MECNYKSTEWYGEKHLEPDDLYKKKNFYQFWLWKNQVVTIIMSYYNPNTPNIRLLYWLGQVQ
jgi:hypothetical protein